MKKAGEILEAVVEDGREGSAGLAFSAFGAGLNISFGMIALTFVGALTGGVGLAAYAVYPIGFLIVILGKQQLFTENTVTPVAVALTNRSATLNVLRLWAVIFVFNVLGAVAFAFVVVHGEVLSATASRLLLDEVSQKMEHGFWAVTIRAVFGGWLVALVAWLVAASQDTISQIFFVWGLVFLIPVAGLTHCIAGSSEVLVGVFSGEASWGDYLGHFLVPATLGNAVGGLVLVTLLNYGQVVGSKGKL
jgi:formate/nitrite transporter FocA (FNT family)